MDLILSLYNEWQSLQPLKAEDQKRLDDKFRMEFNFNSNHMEGNTLTYGETELLLLFGETQGRHELREYEEMKAHDVALKLVIQEAKAKDRPLTENFIRSLNRILLVEPFRKEAETIDGKKTSIEVKIGEYKSRSNHVRTSTGEIFYYATPEETPAMMNELVNWYNVEAEKKELSPIELATLLHYKYIRIHPFEDGNGRIARLLVNFVLLQFDYPMIIIKTDDKSNYLRVLHASDIGVGLTPSDGINATLEEIYPFVEYMKKQLEYALRISIKAAKGESIEEPGDLEKKLALFKKKLGESVDETVEVKYSPEALKMAINNGLKPLFNAWEELLQKFDSLFIDRNISFSFKAPESMVSEGFVRKSFYDLLTDKDFIDYPKILKSVSFGIEVSIKGLRKINTNAVFSGGEITIIFYPHAYEIKGSNGVIINKLYHQPINAHEALKFVEVLGNDLYNKIECIKSNNTNDS